MQGGETSKRFNFDKFDETIEEVLDEERIVLDGLKRPKPDFEDIDFHGHPVLEEEPEDIRPIPPGSPDYLGW